MLATESSPRQGRVLAYAMYLSFIDSGNAASDWITAPIVKHFGITLTDYSGLRPLIMVSVACSVGVLMLLPICVPGRRHINESDREDLVGEARQEPLLCEGQLEAPGAEDGDRTATLPSPERPEAP